MTELVANSQEYESHCTSKAIGDHISGFEAFRYMSQRQIDGTYYYRGYTFTRQNFAYPLVGEPNQIDSNDHMEMIHYSQNDYLMTDYVFLGFELNVEYLMWIVTTMSTR